jgi:hypothetical protein
VAPGRADVTLRYSFDIKPGPMIPAQAAEAMKAKLKPMGTAIYLKGNKAYTTMMGLTAISDFDGALITVLDPEHKRYATVSSAEYAAAISKQAAIPPEASKMFESMKVDVQTRATGRTEAIHGIQAEEREMTLTVEMPSGPQGSLGAMRMVYTFWPARSDEVIRHPVLQELAAYADRAYAGMNPADMMQKMFAQTPATGEKMRTMMAEFQKMKTVLRMHGAVYTPGAAAMMEQLRKAGKPVPAFDPNAPTMEFVMDLQELSGADLADSVFAIPQDYTLAPVGEVVKNMMPVKPGAPPKP